MLIQQIMEKDTDNCYKALAEDGQLNETENIFYSLLSKCPEEVRFDMEQIVNRYMARVTRIAYLQGIVDFTRLYVVLRDNPESILQKYVDT